MPLAVLLAMIACVLVANSIGQLGATAFAFPLYYQFKDWPDAPLGYGNWVAIVWIGVGLVITAWISRARPHALAEADRIFVEDETGAAPAPAPAAR